MPNSKKNIFWSEKIPTVNRAFFIAAALLVLWLSFDGTFYNDYYSSGLGLSPDMSSFILSTFVAFGVLLYIDNYVFKRKLQHTSSSKLDLWIFRFAIIRNFIFTATFIPQIIFMYLLVFTFSVSHTWIYATLISLYGIPVIIYMTLIGFRLKQLKKPIKFNFFLIGNWLRYFKRLIKFGFFDTLFGD